MWPDQPLCANGLSFLPGPYCNVEFLKQVHVYLLKNMVALSHSDFSGLSSHQWHLGIPPVPQSTSIGEVDLYLILSSLVNSCWELIAVLTCFPWWLFTMKKLEDPESFLACLLGIWVSPSMRSPFKYSAILTELSFPLWFQSGKSYLHAEWSFSRHIFSKYFLTF